MISPEDKEKAHAAGEEREKGLVDTASGVGNSEVVGGRVQNRDIAIYMYVCEI